MVRKQTWILLVVFVVLLGVVFYLQKNPLPSSESKTPSPTPQSKLLTGWNPEDIVWMELQPNTSAPTSTPVPTATGEATTATASPAQTSLPALAGPVQVQQVSPGKWAFGPDGKQPAKASATEQIRAQLGSAQVISALPADLDLASVGLKPAAYTLTLRNGQGKQVVLRIGSADPTGIGTYVQVDGQAPVVIEKTVVDAVLEQLTPWGLTPETPTPDTATNPQPSKAP